jgi:hypothetical protein
MSCKPRYALDASQRLELARTLDQEIRAFHRRRNADQAQIAFRLAQLNTSRAYLSLGYSSMRDYAWQVIDWRAAKVKALLTLLGRLPQQPLIAAAFWPGELDWTKAVLASRGAAREPEREAEREAEYLQDARDLTCRALEAKLAGETGELTRTGLWLETTEEEQAILKEFLRARRSEGRRGLTMAEALVELVQEELTGASTGSSSFRVLLGQCPDCEATSLRTGKERVPLSPERAEALTRGAERYDATQRGAHGDTRVIPKAVQDEVRARAGDCCENPGCAFRDDLHFHHLKGRGGPDGVEEARVLRPRGSSASVADRAGATRVALCACRGVGPGGAACGLRAAPTREFGWAPIRH